MITLKTILFCNIVECNEKRNCLRYSEEGINLYKPTKIGCENYLNNRQYKIK
jgi:hypothetical protein